MLTVKGQGQQTPDDADQDIRRGRTLVGVECEPNDGRLAHRRHDRPKVETRGVGRVDPRAHDSSRRQCRSRRLIFGLLRLDLTGCLDGKPIAFTENHDDRNLEER